MPKVSYIEKSLNRTVGKAIHQYGLIENEDRILIGVSGGKDSLALLWILEERRTRVPVRYDIQAVYVDPGFPGGFAEPLQEFCKDRGIPLHVEMTDYGIVAHGKENRENPCFLCARRRRQKLFELADVFGCNKLALGHNKDDLIETLLLNMCYAGEISTMIPHQAFFGGKISLIRPLAMTGADTAEKFCKQKEFPKFINPCPSATRSRRSAIRDLLARLYRSNRKIRGNLFRSMTRVRPEYLLTENRSDAISSRGGTGKPEP